MAGFTGTSTLEIFLRLRDEASAGIRDFGREVGEVSGVSRLTVGELRTLGTTMGLVGGGLIALTVLAARQADTAGRMNQRLAQTNTQMRELATTVGSAVLPIILAFLDAMNATLEVVNALPGPLVQIGGGLALIGGGLLAVLGATAIFISILKELNAILRINIILQGIAKALQGPIGIAQIAAAVVVGAGLGAVTGAIVAGSFQGGTERVPGPPGQPRLIVAHGGESVGAGGGGDVFNFQGIFTGSERQFRALVDRISDFQRKRRNTTTDGSVA